MSSPVCRIGGRSRPAGLRALASIDFPLLTELRVHGNSLDD